MPFAFPDLCRVWRGRCIAFVACAVLVGAWSPARAQTPHGPAASTPRVVVHGVASHFDLIDLGPNFSAAWLEGLLPTSAAPPALERRVTTRSGARKVRTTYDRTTTGKLREKRVERWADTGWTRISRTRYRYRGNARAGQQTSVWVDGAWHPDQQRTFARSDDGRVREVVHHIWRDGQWAKTSRLTIERPDTTQRRRFVREHWSGDHWEPQTRVTFTVAEDGRHIVQRNETWMGAHWENSVLLTFLYDAAGYPIEQTAEVWTGMQWAEGPLYLYDYEIHEQHVVQHIETWIGTSHLTTERTELTYAAPLRAWLTSQILQVD